MEDARPHRGAEKRVEAALSQGSECINTSARQPPVERPSESAPSIQRATVREPSEAKGWSLEVGYSLGKCRKHMHKLDKLLNRVGMKQATRYVIKEVKDQLVQQAR